VSCLQHCFLVNISFFAFFYLHLRNFFFLVSQWWMERFPQPQPWIKSCESPWLSSLNDVSGTPPGGPVRSARSWLWQLKTLIAFALRWRLTGINYAVSALRSQGYIYLYVWYLQATGVGVLAPVFRTAGRTLHLCIIYSILISGPV